MVEEIIIDFIYCDDCCIGGSNCQRNCKFSGTGFDTVVDCNDHYSIDRKAPIVNNRIK